MPKKVLVLGGGFAGVRAALNLSRSKNLEVILINNTPAHCYIPDLYELSTVRVKKETRVNFEEVFNSINIPLKEIFKGKDVEVMVDEVTRIDLPGKKISTRDHGRISYDYLVVALGSETCYYSIEGGWEYSHPFKTSEDALNVRNDLCELSLRSRKEKRSLRVVVAGGGFTGVEVASQLQSALRGIRVTIIEAAPNLLNGMPRWAQGVALERLRILGITVKLNEKILKVTEDEVIGSSKKYKFDYLIWTTGVQGTSVRSSIQGTELGKKLQLVTTAKLNLKDYPEVFVCGDIAQIEDYKRKGCVPATAWAAVGEGKIVARNIKAKLRDKKMSTYNPPSPAFVVPLGGNFAISNAFNFHWVGFSPWFVKQFIALRYFLSILPPISALKVWWKGVRI